MNQRDTIEMMQRCAEEISGLRAQVAALRPKAEAFDAIQQVLGLLPRRSEGMGEDLVWRLKKAIEEEKRALAPVNEVDKGEPK